ncbi:single-strand binding protein [Pusillimonas sp. T7-7]|uniref:hypothetical protein n=1 Tax=Pusillimonas sp. (strain T7-7) TaxID=1007105 RepID=UPI00020848CA|nr:hypothetical protein [Pusillimonas sp. T7-7]AEC21018.1 single-strand binding protein [Pusillimonas sp. T7-7]
MLHRRSSTPSTKIVAEQMQLARPHQLSLERIRRPQPLHPRLVDDIPFNLAGAGRSWMCK